MVLGTAGAVYWQQQRQRGREQAKAGLKQAAQLRQDYRFSDAEAMLKQVHGWAAQATDRQLQQRLVQAQADLALAREASRLPCLRKDFLIDPYQVEEARAWGADAVLLIVAAVDPETGAVLLAAAREARLDVLVEVHDEAELAWAAAAGATLIGINNRDLGSFAVTLATTERLAPRAPAGALVVAESGIRSPADLHRMLAAGARAVLVGEAFMERPDPGGALAEWLCR